MYPFLDRILCKLSTETLFTPIGLLMNKLEEEKREKKSDQLKNFEIFTFIKISEVLFMAIFGFYNL